MACFYQKGMVVVIMGALAARQPAYTKDDLMVAVRDGVHEIITLRRFGAHELFFAPTTTEVKDVFWTQGRSHVVKNTAGEHPENRHWIVDGRLRSNANTDNKDLSFFFTCTRTVNPDEANMKVHYTEASTAIHLALPTKAGLVETMKFDTANSADDTPQLPYMTNTRTVETTRSFGRHGRCSTHRARAE